MGVADMYHKESLYLHIITLVIRIFYDLYTVNYTGYNKDLCPEVIKSKKLNFFLLKYDSLLEIRTVFYCTLVLIKF